jgi:hypothetical protein
MDPIAIHLSEDKALSRRQEPIQLGVPIVRGRLQNTQRLRLTDRSSGHDLACQGYPLGRWPDGTIRWLRLNFTINLDPNQQVNLWLDNAESPQETPAAKMRRAHKSDNSLAVDTGIITIEPTPGQLNWSVAHSGPNEPATNHTIELTDAQDHSCTAHLDDDWVVAAQGSLCTTLSARGYWRRPEGSLLARFECHLHLQAGSDTIQVETRLHNPKRARHPGGLWDLGDPGSVYFRGLVLKATPATSEESWVRPTQASPSHSTSSSSSCLIYQDSSGGERWNSSNHVNARGEVKIRVRGYRVDVDDKTIDTGNRATPIAGLGKGTGAVQASLRQFWQNFPSSLGTQRGSLAVGFFPPQAAEPYELQGGERKTQTAFLNYSDDPEALQWTLSPLTPVLSPEHYRAAEAFPWFTPVSEHGPLEKLIQESLDGRANFFAKREAIDEFGWRNFGDLFADHETLYQEKGEPPHISHYNNQYDGIYGFARQFAMSGDTRWFELMDDLARHVVDIDIYHTEEDRAEYNNGLFWHTDHYLDAHTCTHRTFTRHNNSSSTPGQLGGGPAAEHCYTTGLLYHYWLTGNASSREAVLKLTHWMQTLHQGEPGFLAEVLALKKQELPKLKAMLKGDHVSPHRFPFTRGTGNYITALLDAHLLEPGRGWLARAETIIRHTIHPADVIEQRDLLDTETGWSYLILLASIARFLYIKEEAGDRDGQWRYARDSFLHYTNWMLTHERPFLADTNDLEFANDTWTAQDIRKAMLMFQAAQEDPDNASIYLAKGQEWLDYVTSALRTSPESHLTRLQIILLQSYGPQHLALAADNGRVPDKPGGQAASYRAPTLGWGSLVGQIVARLMKGLFHFRPRREKAWLEARLDR